MALREVKLPSGATLKISVAPFEDAKNLYQAMLEELKALKLDPNADVDVNLYKDLLCAGLSSKKIEACLKKCLERVTIDDLKIDSQTFEPVEKRDDYLTVCFEVAQDNVQPFMKSLYAQYGRILVTIRSVLG